MGRRGRSTARLSGRCEAQPCPYTQHHYRRPEPADGDHYGFTTTERGASLQNDASYPRADVGLSMGTSSGGGADETGAQLLLNLARPRAEGTVRADDGRGGDVKEHLQREVVHVMVVYNVPAAISRGRLATYVLETRQPGGAQRTGTTAWSLTALLTAEERAAERGAQQAAWRSLDHIPLGWDVEATRAAMAKVVHAPEADAVIERCDHPADVAARERATERVHVWVATLDCGGRTVAGDANESGAEDGERDETMLWARWEDMHHRLAVQCKWDEADVLQWAIEWGKHWVVEARSETTTNVR